MALGEGLEVIGEGAFIVCTSQREIIIPPFVRAIKASPSYWWLHEIITPPLDKAIKTAVFCHCEVLTTANLGEGLEEIGHKAFCGCASLHEINIPPLVKMIKEAAFW